MGEPPPTQSRREKDAQKDREKKELSCRESARKLRGEGLSAKQYRSRQLQQKKLAIKT